MLLCINSIRELNFSKLMEIYIEGNQDNGADRWPEEPAPRQLQLAEEAFREYLTLDFFPVAGAVYYIWQEEGVYVSALRLEPYKDGFLLEALETRPELRRRGYGRRLVQAVLKRVPGKVYSHVHKRNTASLRLHEVCGFRCISQRAAYIDGSVNDRCCTLQYTGDGLCGI